VNILHHFQLMAQYNLRMNTQVYDAASQLCGDDLSYDMNAFFKSILGTLNHIMVGDLFWLNRFALLHGSDSNQFSSLQSALQELPKPNALNQILFSDFAELHKTRERLDAAIQVWLSTDASAQDFTLDLTYYNSKGEGATRDFGELVSHLFNHQTHHRGQVSTLLSQKGLDVGGTDFLVDIPLNKLI
jgi:uncharacterized damage-inducible protein DinB